MRIMVGMSATLIHHGHIRLLSRAKEYGTVIVGLTSDDEVFRQKGYQPELCFAARKEIIEAIKFVDGVVETPWLITRDLLGRHNIDVLVHGNDNADDLPLDKLIILPRTEGVSSSQIRNRALASIVSVKNRKAIFSAGPGSLLAENLLGLEPCFGRGDVQYEQIENRVLSELRRISGHSHIVRLQGSATLALEIAVRNFVSGRVLVITTGYYGDRLVSICRSAHDCGRISTLDVIKLQDSDHVGTDYDWVATVYTETSSGLKNDIRRMRSLADRTRAKLLVDATGSIGLEDGHELADVIGYSSCKGLFGLTGAAFVAYNEHPQVHEPSFCLNLTTHAEGKVTGPYHAMCALNLVLPRHDEIRDSVRIGKRTICARYADRLLRSENEQPLLCTLVRGQIVPLDDKIVLYTPRDRSSGTSLICHLGEAHLGSLAKGAIYDRIRIVD
jgi:cytidyltransferase-like protein